MGLFGPPNVEKLAQKGAVKRLVQALGYRDDWTIRRAAAEALGQLGARQADAALRTRAVAPLIAALADNQAEVRMAAAEALGPLGDPRAVEPLTATLKDYAESVRQRSAIALGQIGDPRAAQPLVAVLVDRILEVRQAAAQALDRLGWQPDQGAGGAAYWIAQGKWDRCVRIGPPAVQPLQTVLSSTDKATRRAAARTLGRIGDERAVWPLVSALGDKEKDVRRAVVDALAQLGAPAVRPLIQARVTRAVFERVREDSVAALTKIGAPAVEPLCTSLASQDRATREAAVEVLDKLGWHPDQDAVGAAYWVVRGEWEQCVAIGVPAVEPLLAVLAEQESKDRQQRLRQVHARRAAAGALGQIGARQTDAALCAPAVALLIAALRDSDADTRKAAARALGQIGDPRAIQPLSALLSDKDHDMRQAAVKAIGNVGARQTDAALCARVIESLLTALRDGDKGVRLIAARMLGPISARQADDVLRARAVQPLVATLYDKDPELKEALARSLGLIGPPAVEPLLPLLQRADWTTRKRAAQLLLELYQSGRLDEHRQRLVLDQKLAIMQAHRDSASHSDGWVDHSEAGRRYASDCTHHDATDHQDSGIGLTFPV